MQQSLILFFSPEHSFLHFIFLLVQSESFEISLDDCRWFFADKRNHRLFGTCISTTDRADCPVDTGIALTSFQIIVFFEEAIMKFVIHITYLLEFQFFLSFLRFLLMGF